MIVLSSHIDNCVLVLAEGLTNDTNHSLNDAEKLFTMDFSKVKIKVCTGLEYNSHRNYLFLNKIKIYKFKTDNNKVNFLSQFSSGRISE